MVHRLSSSRVAIAAVSILCGAVLGSGVTSAATVDITDSLGRIHACAGPYGADVRFVRAASNCRPEESHITWNQKGAVGPAGPKGEQGIQGLPGPSSTSYNGAAFDATALPVQYWVPAASSPTTYVLASVTVAAPALSVYDLSTRYVLSGAGSSSASACAGGTTTVDPVQAVYVDSVLQQDSASVTTIGMPVLLTAGTHVIEFRLTTGKCAGVAGVDPSATISQRGLTATYVK